MTEQLVLDGFDLPRPPTDRLFFAIRPDADAATRVDRLVQDLCKQHGLKGKSLGIERFHVTLYHVGDYGGLPADVVDLAGEAARAVSGAAPFRLEFEQVASFSRRPRNMPLVLLGGDGLIAVSRFQLSLAAALARVGLGLSGGANYTPHLTLLYDDRYVAAQAIEPVAWTAHEFVLVRSLIGKGRHEILLRFPLASCGDGLDAGSTFFRRTRRADC